MTHALARQVPLHRMIAALVAVLCAAVVLASATGFGATTTTQLPSADLVGMLAMTDPSAKSADPPVCTDALAPLDTDDCADVTYSAGSTKVLDLGALSGSDVQAAALTFHVTTTNPFGYTVQMSNAGAAPLLQGGAGSIADMQSSPLVPAASVDDATHFGAALGDPVNDNEAAVNFTASPWMNGGQQGELFSGVTTTPMKVAERTSAQASDPFTVTFAAASIASSQPAPGDYAGTVRIVASAL